MTINTNLIADIESSKGVSKDIQEQIAILQEGLRGSYAHTKKLMDEKWANFDMPSDSLNNRPELLQEIMRDSFGSSIANKHYKDWAASFGPHFRVSGFFTEPFAPAFEIMFDRSDVVTDEILDTFRELASLIHNGREEISFSVFDHELNESAIHTLVLSGENWNEAKLVETRYGRTSEVTEKSSLKDALTTLIEFWWYRDN